VDLPGLPPHVRPVRGPDGDAPPVELRAHEPAADGGADGHPVVRPDRPALAGAHDAATEHAADAAAQRRSHLLAPADADLRADVRADVVSSQSAPVVRADDAWAHRGADERAELPALVTTVEQLPAVAGAVLRADDHGALLERAYTCAEHAHAVTKPVAAAQLLAAADVASDLPALDESDRDQRADHDALVRADGDAVLTKTVVRPLGAARAAADALPDAVLRALGRAVGAEPLPDARAVARAVVAAVAGAVELLRAVAPADGAAVGKALGGALDAPDINAHVRRALITPHAGPDVGAVVTPDTSALPLASAHARALFPTDARPDAVAVPPERQSLQREHAPRGLWELPLVRGRGREHAPQVLGGLFERRRTNRRRVRLRTLPDVRPLREL